MRSLIIIFAKAPVAGRVKTRLDADSDRAAALHSVFVRDALSMAETLQDEADVELSTDTPTDAWPESAVRRSLQAEGNLGERMYAALDHALASGRTKVIIMGSDSPLLPPDHPAINPNGELCDRWGTPFFFHAESAKKMEIRSAGPDKKMWNDDDVVFAP